MVVLIANVLVVKTVCCWRLTYMYVIVNLVFSHISFWSGNLFVIAPFHDHCLLVPFSELKKKTHSFL